jgi:hypothetical protein
LRRVLAGRTGEFQPRDALAKLFSEMEKRKKYGIEEKAYVPNGYTVYLSPYDYEEISPLLSGMREQLANKLMDRVKKKGYKLLSSSLSVDIRGDSALMKDQIVIESSFLKEKTQPVSSPAAGFMEKAKREPRDETGSSLRFNGRGGTRTNPDTRDAEKTRRPAPEMGNTPMQTLAVQPATSLSGSTKIIEDRKTKLIDAGRVRLEIIKREGPAEVIALKEGEYTFGRGQDAQYMLEDGEETVSRVHFKLLVRDSRIRIRDLDSLNGTRVNDVAIEEAELHKGDLIAAGKVQLKVA